MTSATDACEICGEARTWGIVEKTPLLTAKRCAECYELETRVQRAMHHPKRRTLILEQGAKLLADATLDALSRRHGQRVARVCAFAAQLLRGQVTLDDWIKSSSTRGHGDDA